jgi:hypothetical protein
MKEYITDWKKAWEEGKIDLYSFTPVSCLICRHLHRESFRRCDAYPDKMAISNGKYSISGIPYMIYSGELEHITPRYGDRGIQFEPLTPDERIELSGHQWMHDLLGEQGFSKDPPDEK